MIKRFEDIVNETIIYIPATVSSRTPTKNLVVDFNYNFLSKFKHIVVVINGNHHTDLCDNLWGRSDPQIFTDKSIYEQGNRWKENFGDKVTVLYDVVNRGWQFGTMDLDAFAFDYIKLNFPNTKWVMRSEENVAYFPEFMNTEINNADLVVMPYFTWDSRNMLIDGYHTDELKSLLFDMVEDRWAIHRMVDFQTSHYIVNIKKFENLYFPISIMRKYYNNYIRNKKDKPDKSTIMLQDNPVFRQAIETEIILKLCSNRKNIKIKLMLNKEQFIKLCKIGCSIPMLPTEKDVYPIDLAFKNIEFADLGWAHLHPEQKNCKIAYCNLLNNEFEFNSKKHCNLIKNLFQK